MPAGAEDGETRLTDELLLPRYYDELRRIARRLLGRSDQRLTLQPTELVNEALVRLITASKIRIVDERHFLALGARTIRMTLIDEVRRRNATKRDAGATTIWDGEGAVAPIDVLVLDGLLDEFAAFEPEGARIVELRFFVGMTMAEIAAFLGLSESTVLRRWRMARAWLLKELQASA